MKKILFIILLLPLFVHAQNFEKIVLDASDETTGYYLAVKPRGEIQGVLVLMPGFNEKPENIFSETSLHNKAYANNILTLVIPFGAKIYADAPTVNNINRALRDSINRFHADSKKYVVGGFSAGGTIALRYAELCHEKPGDYPVVPRAVFSIDSPVDLIDLSRYFNRELKKNFSQAGVNEAKFVGEIMKTELGGTPDSNPASYSFHTPFETRLEKTGNEQFLKNIPVRVYHDVDPVWQLQNRRRSFLDNNATAASELILRLLMMGNDRAEFIQAKQPGHRSNGMRHPHSWNIVDEVEFIQWMKSVLQG